MVQKSRTSTIVLGIFLRVFIILAVVVFSYYSSNISLEILRDYFGYRTPLVDWGDILVDASIAISFGMTFWAALLFGVIGKKIDYIFIMLFLLFGFLNFYFTETVTFQMYIGLITGLVFGSLIGFVLKLLRQRFLPSWKI